MSTLDDELHSTDRVIRWASDPPVQVGETTLSTRETAILDLLRAEANRNLTPSEIATRSPLSDGDTMQVLSGLIATGILELGERSPESKPRKGDNFGAPPFPKKLGRFEVDRLLAQGSMGAVLLANDPAIDRVVAIKLVQTAAHLSVTQRDKYRERFYREASAAGQLLHPAIATVFDVGHTEDGTPFLVMEYVKGETLRELLEKEKPPLEHSLRIARDVLDALAFAHAQGIVHRDVKPSNIMVTLDRRAKIMDFGIAHVMGSELTTGGDVLGSPYYMAPEQLAKGPISARTDLFSFAVVLYRMLTGVLPFTGDSFAAVAHAILHEKPVPPDRRDPAIPRGLSNLVLRCLEKSPQDRVATAPEVLRALTAVESGKAELPVAPGTKRKRLLALSAALVLAVFVAIRGLAPESGEAQAGPDYEVPQPAPAVVAAPPPPEPKPAATEPFASSPVVRPSPPREKSADSVKPETSVRSVRPRVEDRAEADQAPEPAPPQGMSAPKEADLFYEARVALERGDLEKSRAILETLFSRNPSFAGASELYLEVTDQIWEKDLPLRIPARHKHRLGSCEGELSLASLGVRFQSQQHDWAFRPEDMRVMERPEEAVFIVETFEKDTLSLGKNKRYRFELDNPLPDADWTRYQRLLK
jgi:predicted Ser/Thr protein kinase/outer membrane biosynthesis protein TonB